MKSLIPNLKSNKELPSGKVSFTPNNELVINYKDDSFLKRLFTKYDKLVLFALFVFAISYYLGIYFDYKYHHIFGVFFSVSLLTRAYYQSKSEHQQQITFTSNGYEILNLNTRNSETIELNNKNRVDFKVKVIEDNVALNIENQQIYFNDIQQIPIVIDHIATLWDLEYTDTNHFDKNTEILTYTKKQLPKSSSKSLLIIEENDKHLIICDALDTQRYLFVDKKYGAIKGHKSIKEDTFYRNRPLNNTIRIEGITKQQSLGYSRIEVKIIHTTGEQEVFFISKNRYNNDTKTVFDDVELIFNRLKALPILEGFTVDELFK